MTKNRRGKGKLLNKNVKLMVLITGLLLLMPLTLALDECSRTITQNDIPCMVVSTWNYTDCNTTTVKIYNNTPTLIKELTFSDYNPTGLCNFTWNITTVGNYVWTTSNYDTGNIEVEVDDKMNLAIIIALTGFSIFFIGSGIWLIMHDRRSEEVSDV